MYRLALLTWNGPRRGKMSNPFRLRWLEDWSFQIVLMDGHIEIEASGHGISLRTSLLPGESPQTAADRLISSEWKRLKELKQAWKKGYVLNKQEQIPTTNTAMPISNLR